MTYLAIALLAYGGVVGVLYAAQAWLVFPGRALPSRPIDGPMAPERIELEADDGVRLHGQLFRAVRGSGDLLIGFGGNAQDAELLGHDLADDFPDVDVAVFHYRGYGPSKGRPSEQTVLADALLIHDRLKERLRPERTFAIGISLGSGVVTYLSKQRALDGIILITPFDSIEAIARENYFWAPVGLLLRHRFPSIDFMADNPTPVAVIAAEKDSVVKPHRTRALIERIPNLVFHEVVPGADHATISQIPIYEEALAEAYRALAAAPARSRARADG